MMDDRNMKMLAYAVISDELRRDNLGPWSETTVPLMANYQVKDEGKVWYDYELLLLVFFLSFALFYGRSC